MCNSGNVVQTNMNITIQCIQTIHCHIQIYTHTHSTPMLSALICDLCRGE